MWVGRRFRNRKTVEGGRKKRLFYLADSRCSRRGSLDRGTPWLVWLSVPNSSVVVWSETYPLTGRDPHSSSPRSDPLLLVPVPQWCCPPSSDPSGSLYQGLSRVGISTDMTRYEDNCDVGTDTPLFLISYLHPLSVVIVLLYVVLFLIGFRCL